MRLFILPDYSQDDSEERHQKCCHEKWYDLVSISNRLVLTCYLSGLPLSPIASSQIQALQDNFAVLVSPLLAPPAIL